MDPAAWSGRRVLVTGHTGFKGSWLSLWLQALGARVAGLALPPDTTPDLFGAARVADGMASHLVDVRDGAAVARVVSQVQPEIVFHLAAQPLVRRSYGEPVETFATNVMGTVHLLEALRQTGTARVVVVVTTDKCYENREWVWPYREDEPLGGNDPYSASKACAEIVAAAYRRSFFPPEFFAEHGTALATARAGNVIGGGDWAQDRLVPDIVRAFSRGESVLIRHPDAVRPWQHVLDSLGGYLLLAQTLLAHGPAAAEAFNFGPSDADVLTVRQIVDLMAGTWGAGAGWQLDRRETPHEAQVLRLDSSKARQRLGWKPRLGLGEAVRWTSEWYKAMSAGADARKLTLAQIETYGHLASAAP